jgi:eukaryotic translation initiation factor 2C
MLFSQFGICLTPNRVEMITTSNIRSMMMPLFEYWVKNVGGGQGPSHIYYFRDGVSEGQYEHVLQQEVHDMKKCVTERYPQAKVK